MTQRATDSPEKIDRVQHIADQLADRGWCVTPDFVTARQLAELAAQARECLKAGDFHPAGVGRANGLAVRPDVRRDQVHWLDPATLSAAQQAYFDQLEQLRLAINRRLYLGLFDFEGHLAVYPPGSFYRRHLDRFQDVGLRTVSTILYLNEDWDVDDGGQLRIYTDPADPQAHQDLLPVGGTLVAFLSAEFEHEVLPARRERLSLTGWFRVRDAGHD